MLDIVQPQRNPVSSALQVLKEITSDIRSTGIGYENIFLMGFSQGACLALEFATRSAQKWAGVIALTGGLIGDKIYSDHYSGNFNGASVLMTNSQNDPHVPLKRSEDSKSLIEELGANVSLKIYQNRPHTILADEIDEARKLLESK